MPLHTLALLLAYLATASSRDMTKIPKIVPTITNSLVNLGKMDISFYFNGKPKDIQMKMNAMGIPFNSFSYPKPPQPIIDEPCPCSSIRNMKDSFLSNPSEIINKIVRSNDFFNKDAFTSAMCCDSHEHIQEDAVFFEFAPNRVPLKPSLPRKNPMHVPPFTFDRVIPNRAMGNKAIEIFLFPKRKDIATFDIGNMALKKKDMIAKDGIQAVGDKELKSVKTLTIPDTSSVKKDLHNLEKIEKKILENDESFKTKTAGIEPNTI